MSNPRIASNKMGSEIILRSKQFCNLSEVVVRPEDTLETLIEKVRLATVLGTLQATRTDFVYLSEDWSKNTKEEALLGVSLTGIMDHPTLSGGDDSHIKGELLDSGEVTQYQDEGSFDTLPYILNLLREVAVETNAEWAERLGINRASAITCVKFSASL